MSAKFNFIVAKGPAMHITKGLSMEECQRRLATIIETQQAKVEKLTTQLTDGMTITIEREK